MSIDLKSNNVDFEKVNLGDLMAFVYFGEVVSLDKAGEKLNVRNRDTGTQFSVLGKELISHSFSADQFSKEEMVSKTRAAEILTYSANQPFTVSFEKTDGSERILRGRLIAPEPLLGRSMVEDLDLPHTEKNRIRQVDHRTINWLIVNGVKYTVK